MTRKPLPAHLVKHWGNLTVDPRDAKNYCYTQSRRTPSIPWHNGYERCLACGKTRAERSA